MSLPAPGKTGRTPAFKDAAGRPLESAVAEAGALTIGGLAQWVLIRGRNRGAPLLIILHGGPGSSETSLFRAFNAELEDAFVVVYWDQRGAGRSYFRSIDPASMNTEQFLADLDELVDAMLAKFGQRKAVLLGHSWGSVLGVLYAVRHPEKVAAYVGVGQVADMLESETQSYAFTLAEAEKRGRRGALKALRAIGPPPHDYRKVGTERRWLMAFGGAFGPEFSLPRTIWRAMRTPESSPLDLIKLLQGSMFSLKLLWPELIAVNLRRDARRFDTPVFFILGRHDMQVVAGVAAAYFDEIEAPHKQLFWLEKSGHFLPFEEPAEFNRILIDVVRPFALEPQRPAL
jgi:pimeloyl-ACP methyl ester carboxylesterase